MIPYSILSCAITPLLLPLAAVATETENQRVGGAEEAPSIITLPGPEGPLYKAGVVSTDTKLPVGYPAPTPPGAIEVKEYPQLRRAEVTGDGERERASQRGFFPLFRHISRHGIAMTAPVEMEYAPADGPEPDSWTMAFLYHTESDGDVGPDAGGVRVVDAPGVTVISLGIRGVRNLSDPETHADSLYEWLEASDEWRAVEGSPVRVLGYNGPYVPPANRWWEVQIVVEAAEPITVETELPE